MYKLVFKNSKIALLFAVMTLFSALTMVGTSEDGGALVDLKNMAGDMRARAQSEAAAAAARAAGPASIQTAAPVFGEYVPPPIPQSMPDASPPPVLSVEGAPPAAVSGPVEAKGTVPLGIAPAPTLVPGNAAPPVTDTSSVQQ
jgi:hypothetical protein